MVVTLVIYFAYALFLSLCLFEKYVLFELCQEFFKSYKYYLETQNQLDLYVDDCCSNQQAVFLQNGTLACSLQTLSVHVFVNFCLYAIHKNRDIFETQSCTVLEGRVKSLFARSS